MLTHARAKLARKGCDVLVVNDVSGGQVFGRSENAVVVLTADGEASDVLEGSKDAVAAGIWAAITGAAVPTRTGPDRPARPPDAGNLRGNRVRSVPASRSSSTRPPSQGDTECHAASSRPSR